jgi:hypothetical protein
MNLKNQKKLDESKRIRRNWMNLKKLEESAGKWNNLKDTDRI